MVPESPSASRHIPEIRPVKQLAFAISVFIRQLGDNDRSKREVHAGCERRSSEADIKTRLGEAKLNNRPFIGGKVRGVESDSSFRIRHELLRGFCCLCEKFEFLRDKDT